MTDLATNVLYHDDNVIFRDESGKTCDAQQLTHDR
jgi:hypothetical protein